MTDLNFCAIGLGSNLGDSRSILAGAVDRLRSHPQIGLIAVSSWYLTAPIGPPQPDYLNGCVTIETSLDALAVLSVLQEIESDFGRVRQERWGARTLDLDLLLYDSLVIDLPTLQVPHPLILERAFVMVPLAEIAPDQVEPRSGKSIITLCKQLEYSSANLLVSIGIDRA